MKKMKRLITRRATMLAVVVLAAGVVSLGLAGVIWSNASAEPASLLSLLGILLGIEMLFDGFGLIFMGMFAKKAEA